MVRRKKQLNFTRGGPAVQLVMPDVKAVDNEYLDGHQPHKPAVKVKDGRPTRRNALDLANYQTTKLKTK